MTSTSWSSFNASQIVVLMFFCSSSMTSAQFRDRTPPTAPTNLTVTATTETSVSLSWGSSTDNSQKFNYLINGAGPTVTVSGTQTSHTVTGLSPAKTYTIRLYGRDLSGNLSKSSNAVTVTLPGQSTAPTKPVVRLLGAGPTHASLSWSSSDDGFITWYSIYIDGEQVAALSSLSGTFACARVMVPTYCDPLNQGTTYAFTVRARDNDGNLSPMSDPLFVTTDPIDPDDQAPPAPPGNLTSEGDGAVRTVRWTPSTDDLAPPQFIRYDVYVNGGLSAVVVGQTEVDVEMYFGENTITVIAVDTADRESAPATIAVIH
jgi:chitinase